MNTDRRAGFNIDFAVVSGIKFYPIYDGRQWFVSRCGQVLGAKGNVLVLRDNGKGYKLVSYQETNGKIRNKYVHRLVAATFLEKSGTLVNHKDGNKANNGVNNLEWTTTQGNALHAISIGLVTNIPVKGQQGFQNGSH